MHVGHGGSEAFLHALHGRHVTLRNGDSLGQEYVIDQGSKFLYIDGLSSP
ncbi:hypothetical protein [Halomonas salipaludis]|nr:hypothetical protein [Halomonas salipaludis]